MPSASPRILVIRRRYLGDIALLGSFFRNLRLHWPSAKISALVEPPYAGVLTMNPDVDTILTLPTGGWEWMTLARALRRARFTHVFDLDNTEKTALLTRLTGAPFRARLELENVRVHLPSFYSHRVPISSVDYSAQPISETHLRLLSAADVPVATREIRLVPRAEELAKAQALAGNTSPKILLHPGSRSAFRIWPVENFAALSDRIQNELHAKVFIVGGPKEQELVAAICAKATIPVARVPATLTVPEFAALAAQFDVMLCHDSGPMHLAAAVGTPVIALFGSQNATVWGPSGDRHTVLQPPLPCEHCVTPSECVPGDSYRNHCVRRIGVEEVFAVVRAKLVSKP